MPTSTTGLPQLASDDIFVGQRNQYQSQLTHMNQVRMQSERQSLLNRIAAEELAANNKIDHKEKAVCCTVGICVPLVLLLLAAAGVAIWLLVIK